MDLLGKGGKQFQRFDDAYAQAYRDRLMVEPNSGMFSNLRNFVGALGGGSVTRGPAPVVMDNGAERMPQGFVENVYGYTFPASAATIRYGIPAAGVTAAGIGIMDIIDALNAEKAMEYHDENIMIPFNPNS